MFLRHKERKFGPGCVAHWRDEQAALREQLEGLLTPLDQMLAQRPFLLDDRPRFVDFDLFGILAYYTFSGQNQIPSRLTHLQQWRRQMKRE